tara:strand:- start:302 stop:493 length:192 start_codon:yes stop_codon:yes gene_type:complete
MVCLGPNELSLLHDALLSQESALESEIRDGQDEAWRRSLYRRTHKLRQLIKDVRKSGEDLCIM